MCNIAPVCNVARECGSALLCIYSAQRDRVFAYLNAYQLTERSPNDGGPVTYLHTPTGGHPATAPAQPHPPNLLLAPHHPLQPVDPQLRYATGAELQQVATGVNAALASIDRMAARLDGLQQQRPSVDKDSDTEEDLERPRKKKKHATKKRSQRMMSKAAKELTADQKNGRIELMVV